jgi:hypothetical protein
MAFLFSRSTVCAVSVLYGRMGVVQYIRAYISLFHLQAEKLPLAATTHKKIEPFLKQLKVSRAGRIKQSIKPSPFFSFFLNSLRLKCIAQTQTHLEN